ncbi:DUF559 domain-containing protein [Microbacterium sp. 1P10UB]|uniref:endonuclease domain-containing protein n=1 Tax=unclassified Microbacterium TaxID=2609290 RepID=UPI0039A2C1FC
MRRSRDEDASILSAVRAAGGVVRGTALVSEGHRRRTIAALVETGALMRVRRVWLAAPDADPFAVAAARGNVVVSCVTQARRMGMWVLGEGPPHVAAPSGGARIDVARGTVVHWGEPIVPRAPHVLFDCVENVLALVCACQPAESALATIESALQQGIAEQGALLRLPLSARMRSLVITASPWSDSGLETLFRVRLAWLRLPIRAQIWISGHRVDLLIGDRLVVQIDGRHHVGAQRTEDIRHDAELMLRGYHVIRVGYQQIIHRWPEVQDLIMRAVAQRLHLVP